MTDQPKPCPHCGYCPTCGRGGEHPPGVPAIPYVPNPWQPSITWISTTNPLPAYTHPHCTVTFK